MEVIIDASALLAVVLDEPERRAIIEATAGSALMAPKALPFEIGNALTALYKRGRLEKGDVSAAWKSAHRIPVQLVPVEIEAAIQLALAHGLYAYDAYYLQGSIAYRRPLLTLDRRMREVAGTLGISLLV